MMESFENIRQVLVILSVTPFYIIASCWRTQAIESRNSNHKPSSILDSVLNDFLGPCGLGVLGVVFVDEKLQGRAL